MSAALAGSIVCFYFCRRWFKAQVRKLMAKNTSLKAVVRTVERRGFRLLVLIRLAPYPYNIMNALLSATHIPLSTFTLATAISLVKLSLHVYIGSTLSSFAGHDDDDGEKDPQAEHGRKLKMVVMFFSMLVGIGVGAYVWLVAKREIAITEELRIERRRRRRSRRVQGEVGIGRGRERARYPGYELSSNVNRQNGIPDVDLTNGSSFEGLFDDATGRWEGALPASSELVGGRYHDDEDEHDDGQEDQSLFRQGQQQVSQHGDWRNVGANVDSSTDESDESDFLDNGDDDEEEGGMSSRRSHELPVHHHEEEEEALDFSAHHVGLGFSPWQDEDEDETDDLDGRGHTPVIASSNRVTNSQGW
ncbi:hypothetical protein BGZ51_006932 [Haplosporangium sp. Z 767]|nr:hypothetical protein BGZ51_006932 [Haplosporangium sp. Z 767]